MRQYLVLLKTIIDSGAPRDDRTGVGTLGIFSYQMEFNLSEGYPLVTTRKLAWKNMVHELLWMISGSNNANDLPEETRHWWRPWADNDGRLGPTYGAQLRRAQGIYYGKTNQLSELAEGIKRDPYSRRHILTTWNAHDVHFCKLPPCHGLVTQFYKQGEILHCKTYQRSADAFIGLPYNIASYALLLSMIAHIVKAKPGRLIYDIGDAHIYNNHVDQVKTQLERQPKRLPVLALNEAITDLFEFTSDDISIEGYEPHPPISAEVAI